VQWLLELRELFSCEQTMSYLRLPGGIMESPRSFCRNPAWVQPCLVAQWWPHWIWAAAVPSTLIVSVLHLLAGPVPPLPSAPQDPAPEVVKLFQETKLSLIQRSQTDISSVTSITTAWLIPNPDRLPAGACDEAAERCSWRQQWCWWLLLRAQRFC